METTLGIEVVGRRLYDICRTVAFNELKIDLAGIQVRYNDCEATYSLVAKGKLTKKQIADVSMLVRGVVCCFKAF